MTATISLTLALLVILILFIKFQKRVTNKNDWLLIASLLLGSCFLLAADFLVDHINTRNTSLLLCSNLCVLLFMPCVYLYLRAILLKEKTSWGDLKHVLPAVVYFTNYLIFFLSWGKNSVMTEFRNEISEVNSYYGDFLDPGLAYISFSSYVTIIYLLLQINTLFTSLKHISFHIIKQNIVALKWIMLFGMMQSFFFYYWLSGRHAKGMMELYLLQVLVIASCIIVAGSFIAKYINSYFENSEQPSFTPIIEPEVARLENVPSPPVALIPEGPLHPGITLKVHQLVQIQEKINTTMIEQKLFLNHGYTIRMLSEDTGIQPHILSAYINKQHGVNFNDFVNEYRIKHCIEKIKNDEWKHKTLEALCKESGFNNRNSFTLSFKKVIGLTPSDFLKALKPI